MFERRLYRINSINADLYYNLEVKIDFVESMTVFLIRPNL